MSEDRPTSRITPEEDLLIVETPAVLSNKFYVTSNPYGTKITFAEESLIDGEQKIRPRCAVYLIPNDIRALYQLLEPIVEGMKMVQVGDKDPSSDV